MAQTLATTLGGLLNRRVYHMPVTRFTRLSVSYADNIRKMAEECVAHRGVMLVQPEHLLSFRNMGIDSGYYGRNSLAKSLLSTQAFFQRSSRNIVDECDEVFSTKLQLDYTMGSSRLIEGGSNRWKLIQEILNLVPDLAAQIKRDLPVSIDIRCNNDNSFPKIRILKPDAAARLREAIARHISEHDVVGIPIQAKSPAMREAILHYLSQPEMIEAEIHFVQDKPLLD